MVYKLSKTIEDLKKQCPTIEQLLQKYSLMLKSSLTQKEVGQCGIEMPTVETKLNSIFKLTFKSGQTFLGNANGFQY